MGASRGSKVFGSVVLLAVLLAAAGVGGWWQC